MIQISDEAKAYVRERYPENFAHYLLHSDGFEVDRKRTGFASIFDDLVERGYMRRSRRGRYWWRRPQD